MDEILLMKNWIYKDIEISCLNTDAIVNFFSDKLTFQYWINTDIHKIIFTAINTGRYFKINIDHNDEIY